MAPLVGIGGALRAGGRLFGAVVRKQPGVRHSGDSAHAEPAYRQIVHVSKSVHLRAEILSSFMWFWILWHFWHKPEDIFGHFPYPDPSKWTDEELGLEPEDE
ncbi:NADH dehydrogenase [ubiquinone] 1 beta subcomplex subunit 2, mitochondrial isoform 1-T2 [Mantella aurantiaca]